MILGAKDLVPERLYINSLQCGRMANGKGFIKVPSPEARCSVGGSFIRGTVVAAV